MQGFCKIFINIFAGLNKQYDEKKRWNIQNIVSMGQSKKVSN